MDKKRLLVVPVFLSALTVLYLPLYKYATYLNVPEMQEHIVTFRTKDENSMTVRQFARQSAMLSPEQQEELEEKLLQAQQTKKYILAWYSTKERKNAGLISKKCGKCEITNNRSLINHPDTGAVVFLYKDIDPKTMPSNLSRRQDQLHVWYTGEAPSSLFRSRKLLLTYENTYGFNVTQTYRRDSGIYHPYGVIDEIIDRLDEKGLKDAKKILSLKSKLSVAVVSNCNAIAGAQVRQLLIQNLKEEGLDLETFGDCYGSTIPKNESKRFETSLTKYKFYLALENSYHCRDYITEKFFINGLRTGTVPVVWGAKKEEYEAVAPKDSFIFAEDFASVRHLAEYLKYLDKNDTAYLEYFRWHERDKATLPMYGRSMRFCQLCRQIHGINVDDMYIPNHDALQPDRPLFTDGVAHRTVTSLKIWYYSNENRECLAADSARLKPFSNFTKFLT